ncbi:unnamed protein product [Camellia sinensis]
MTNADVEAVDFEPEDDDLMDEDGTVDVDAASSRAPLPKLKSTITGGFFAFAAATAPKKTKGRGFQEESDADRNNRLASRFDSLNSDGGPGPERCKGPHLSLRSKFVNDIACRTNFLRHQVLQSPPTSPLPATTSSESELKMEQRLANTLRITVNEKKFIETALLSAINEMDGTELLTQTINVDWAFSKGPFKRRIMRRMHHHVDTVQEVLGEDSNHARICGFMLE